MQIDFVVFDIAYQDSLTFATEQDARDWIEEQCSDDPSYCNADFRLYRRERLDI